MSTTRDPLKRATVEPVLINEAWLKRIKKPPFQRPLRVNDKVKALVEDLKAKDRLDGVLPGILTVGRLNGDHYLLDGQHRVEAFVLSGLAEGYADVRIREFSTIGEMGEEYVELNSQLVKLRPDDILRGLESSHAGLALVRRRCPYIGYDNIRRDAKAPLVSASLALRSWYAAQHDVPKSPSVSSIAMVDELTKDEAERMAEFFQLCHEAWGADHEYARLWSALNLTLCAWLYRRCVTGKFNASTMVLTKDVFRKALTGLSSEAAYLDYLVGRQLTDRDRSPCYARLKACVTRRAETETGKRVKLPMPSWANWSREAKRFGRTA